jgi:hypothetical protein
MGNCDLLTAAENNGSTSHGMGLWKVLGISLSALLLLAVPVLPLLWRTRERARRLRGGPPAEGLLGPDPDPDPGRAGPHGDPDGHQPRQRASHGARTLAAWRELIDTGWDYGIPPDGSETPRRAVARLIRDGGLDERAGEAARRVAGAAEEAMYAPRPQSSMGVAEDVRLAIEGLRRSAARTTRLQAVLMPRSAARVVWQLSDRRSAAARRWSAALRRTGAALRPSRRQA